MSLTLFFKCDLTNDKTANFRGKEAKSTYICSYFPYVHKLQEKT